MNVEKGEISIYTPEEFENIMKELEDHLPKDGDVAFYGDYFILKIIDLIENGIL